MPTENLLCLRRGCAFAVSLSCLLAPARAGDSQRPEVSWIESTPLPEPRDGFAAGILGDELIVAGGTYWSGTHGNWQQKQFARGVHAFNPQKAVWRALPQAPVSFGYPASAALGGRLFVLGGLHDGAASGDVYSLQPTAAASAWEREPPMPEPRIFATAVAYGTCLYVIGGTREYEPFDAKGTCCTSRTATTTVWVLDVAQPAPRWRSASSYPGPARWLHSAVLHNGFIYVFGGIVRNSQASENIPLNDVLRYDPKGDQWSRVTALPEELQLAAPVSVRDGIILVGTKGNVARFVPEQHKFIPLPSLPRAAVIPYFGMIGRFLVGTGGEREGEAPRRRSDWTFVGALNGPVAAPR